MSITEELAAYLVHAKYEEIPPEAVLKAKELVLDDIGNALGGSILGSGKIIIQWANMLCGAPESTLISDGTRVPASVASGVNTQLAMGTD